MKNVDHTGENFGRLTLIKKGEPYISPKRNRKKQRYYCSCSCGKYTKDNPKLIVYEAMKSGLVSSCGCIKSEKAILRNKEKAKQNLYKLDIDYGIGYTANTNSIFLFDLDDYNLIKNYTWYETELGYIKTRKDNSSIFLHRLILLNCCESDKIVDHINHKVYDNRKSNLRFVTFSQNQMNKIKQSNNTSGFVGVHLNKSKTAWEAAITVNKKQIYLGTYKDIKDAIKARNDAEEYYFKDYSYNNSINLEQMINE